MEQDQSKFRQWYPSIVDKCPTCVFLNHTDSVKQWKRLARLLNNVLTELQKVQARGDLAANRLAQAIEKSGKQVPHDFMQMQSGQVLLGWFEHNGFQACLVAHDELPKDLRELQIRRILATNLDGKPWLKFEWNDDEVEYAFWLDL